MRKVDQAHDAEHDGEPEGRKTENPAKQNA